MGIKEMCGVFNHDGEYDLGHDDHGDHDGLDDNSWQ